jgi:hypothetical protein
MHAGASLAILAALQNSPAIQPRPAPPVFVSSIYGLTFQTPPGSFYCPLPDDWRGSDHGTTVFLQSPEECGGAGYASSSRNYLRDVPLVSIYYGYAFGDGERSEASCKKAGRARLFGEPRPLCRKDKDGKVIISVTAGYMADSPAEAIVTLETTPNRLDQDIRRLVTLAASVRACSIVYYERGKKITMGSGIACPKDGGYF